MADANKEAVETFFNAIRFMGVERPMTTAIMEKLNSSHRTDQQTFWRIIQMVAYEYSKTESCDGRNEHSVKFTKAVSDIQIPLPFI
jgi:methylphosphotriester-DNA--protein-cysteine methyltransferase